MIKTCCWCKKSFENFGSARFCNRSCGTKWRNENFRMFAKFKKCPVCNIEFKPMSAAHRYCSSQCKGKIKYLNGRGTENQYNYISGNPKRYFLSIIQTHKRKKDGMTVDLLLKMLQRQNGCCALSGRKMTFLRKKGVITKTNASIDRLIPGGKYTEDNIQLVCRAVNSWRGDLSINEYIQWCKEVTQHAEKKENSV